MRVRIFFDVDFTLLSIDRIIRPGTVRLFERLTRDGHEIFVWSGSGSSWARTAVDDHGLSEYVSGVFEKPTFGYVGRLAEVGVHVQPDFVVDDHSAVVDAFGGFQIVDYSYGRRGPQPDDPELDRCYTAIAEHAAREAFPTMLRHGEAMLSQAARVASALRVADHIVAGVRGARELAVLTGCDEDALARLLRYLSAAGLLTDTMELTSIGAGMRIPLEIADAATENLLHCVRTGRPSAPSLWDLTSTDTHSAALFGAFMEAQALVLGRDLADRFDWTTFVDVGGGTGAVARGILAAHPSARGTIIELGETARIARDAFVRDGLDARCAVVDGSFFDDPPVGADAYMLCRIVHDWPDVEAERILSGCARAGGRVIVVEQPRSDSVESLSRDLLMLALGGGRERTVEEHDELAGRAGLRRRSSTGLSFGFVAIEYERRS